MLWEKTGSNRRLGLRLRGKSVVMISVILRIHRFRLHFPKGKEGDEGQVLGVRLLNKFLDYGINLFSFAVALPRRPNEAGRERELVRRDWGVKELFHVVEGVETAVAVVVLLRNFKHPARHPSLRKFTVCAFSSLKLKALVLVPIADSKSNVFSP